MKFKSTRDQVVDGAHVGKGDTVEVDAERVSYLIDRGYLVEEAPKKAKSKSAKADKAE
ncbi:hypothetical protein FIU82_06085 [Pseudoalteromonas sp. THAF3]|uniref:hypothetical protein n=1 Tax=Pseudoalteromonas sp. THAF3 TaxID=2587843 RepID=UPI0012A7907B|nr:hypothetical protein [Pseudoalteromonas sp. THAF3]QFU04585.1 hypothetical protein FIU82_06085 [Pseudoalteromonas sp. THAF3]